MLHADDRAIETSSEPSELGRMVHMQGLYYNGRCSIRVEGRTRVWYKYRGGSVF